MTRKNKMRKEDICEDYCFGCKDGGNLIICDYKDCLKAYHLECIEKDESFLDSGERWNCWWHYCFLCAKLAKFSCFGCPRGVCGRCIHDADFVVVRGRKGFCEQCLKLAMLIENGPSVDSEEKAVDFKDESTYEFFFSGYWEYIKQKEGLTKECVRSASELLKKGAKYRYDSYLHDSEKNVEAIGDSEEESHCLVSDYDDADRSDKFPPCKTKRGRKSKSKSRKKDKSKKKEFVGWGSKSLLDFLASVNKDTTEPLAENEVVSILMDYCKEHKLFDPEKKRRIICDETLRALFGRKFLLKNSLSRLLVAHFAANMEDSAGDRLFSSSSEDSEVNYKRKTLPDAPKQGQQTKASSETPKSCFAMVNAENIKLVYLSRSLVEALSKKPESFDKKVVGSFVRVKCNPNDYLQKNSHQLLQVKGVTTSKTGDILLQFFNCPEEFPINKLSDDNFTGEECDDLRNKIEDGLLKKPTVVELVQKAKILHEDITNHWIPKELALLQKRIDHANEKGWRREMAEYMDRMQLLKNPSEQSRLLTELPEIIAEIAGPELAVASDDRDGCVGSPKTPVIEASSPEYPYLDWGSGIFSDQSDAGEQENQSKISVNGKLPQQSHLVASKVIDEILERESQESVLQTKSSCRTELFPNVGKENQQAFTSEGQINVMDEEVVKQPRDEEVVKQPRDEEDVLIMNQRTSKVDVIQVSDDEAEYMVETSHQPGQDFDDRATRDEKNQCKRFAFGQSQKTPTAELVVPRHSKQDRCVEIGDRTLNDIDAPIWYCVSVHGHRKGPFRMSLLKNSYDSRDHGVKFKVWRIGEKEEEAIPLEDVICKLFSG